jgi:hypothetical protein
MSNKKQTQFNCESEGCSETADYILTFPNSDGTVSSCETHKESAVNTLGAEVVKSL